MKLTRKISDGIYVIEKALAVLFGTVMFLSLFFGFLFRYILNSPLVWSSEIAIFSFVWLTLIGASMGLKNDQTAVVTIFVDLFKKKAIYKWLLAFSFMVIIIFSIYILYLCYYWLLSSNVYLQKSDSLRLSMIYPYLSIPIGFIFLLIHSVEQFFFAWQLKEEEVE